MREDQLARHWDILLNLDANRHGMTARELAELAGCSIRTIYRDLDALERAGFPLTTVKSPEGTKHLFTEDYHLKIKMNFSPIELMSLYLAAETFGSMEGTVFHEALNNVKKKVESSLGGEHRKYARAAQTTFYASFRPVRNYARFRETIRSANQSLVERKALKISYWSPGSGELTEREIEPYRLWFVNGALYLVAYCRLRGEVRTFLVDRIRKCALSERSYKIDEKFDFEKYASRGFKVKGGGPEREVVVRVHPLLKPQITEQTWHPTQKVEEIGDGWMRVSFRLSALDEIKTWVQGYAPYIVVEKPGELIDQIRRSFEISLGMYEENKPGKA